MSEVFIIATVACTLSMGVGFLIGMAWNNVHRSEGYDHGYSNAIEGEEN